jgi:acetyl esterase
MPVNLKRSGPPSSRHEPDREWTYKAAGNVELKAHGFLPRNGQPRGEKAAFLFFHPGGWSMGEPAWGYDICHRYASLGMVAISFEYRLSVVGGNTPVEAACDARSAVRWTRQQADSFGLDPNRLVAAGVSAGAHLALCAAMVSAPDDPADNPVLSAVPNVLVLQSAPVNSASDSHFVELLQGRYGAEDHSPAHHVRSGLPPMCLIHGTADEIVPYDSVKSFAEKMRQAGNVCELYTFEGTDHFFSKKSDQVEALKAMDGFILKMIGSANPAVSYT